MPSIFSKCISNVFKTSEEPNQMLFRLKSIFKGICKEKSELSPYIITRAEADDHHRILKLMHESYYINEPTLSSLGIKQHFVLDESTLRALEEGYTLVARYRHDGSITGACINQSCNSWDPDMKEKLASSVLCSKVRMLLTFQAFLQRVPELWAYYAVKKIFEMKHIFVDKAHKHQGLELKLLRQSKIFATENGFKLIRCDATSTRLAKLCEELDMVKVAEIPYESYLGWDFKPIFKLPVPDLSVKVYINADAQLWNLKNVDF